jgi:hypothetical protein
MLSRTASMSCVAAKAAQGRSMPNHAGRHDEVSEAGGAVGAAG